MQYSLQTDVWFKYSTSLSLRNCSRYAMLSPCFVRFSVPLQTSKTGKESFIGVWGGVNRSRKRWGTHSLISKKNKKNKISPLVLCICLLIVFRILDVCLVDSMLDLYLCTVYLPILPSDLSILSSARNKIKIFASIIWILEFS